VSCAAGLAVPFIVAILSLLFPALLTNCGYTRCLSHVGTEGKVSGSMHCAPRSNKLKGGSPG
jgi:hypothetical protein